MRENHDKLPLVTLARRLPSAAASSSSSDGSEDTLTSMSINLVGACYFDFPLLPPELCPHTKKGYACPAAKQRWSAPLEELLSGEFYDSTQELLQRCVVAGKWSAARLLAASDGSAPVLQVSHPCKWFQNAEGTYNTLLSAAGAAADRLPTLADFRVGLRRCLKRHNKLRWARMSEEEHAAVRAERKARAVALWKNRSEATRVEISATLRLRWTPSRKARCSAWVKKFLGTKSQEELQRSARKMRAMRTRAQQRALEEDVTGLYTQVIVNGEPRHRVCSEVAFKKLQGRYRVFEARLPEEFREKARLLFRQSSAESKARSVETRSKGCKRTLETDVTLAHARCQTSGIRLPQDEDDRLCVRLRTAFGSLAKAPPDLLALLEEARGGQRKKLAVQARSDAKLEVFKRDVADLETSLATRGPKDGMLSTQEARKLAARHASFVKSLDASHAERYDKVYKAYLWRNGPCARRRNVLRVRGPA